MTSTSENPLFKGQTTHPDPIFQKIEELYNEVSWYAADVGVIERNLSVLLKVNETTTLDDLEADYEFLKSFKENEVAEFLKVWKWATPEQWRMKEECFIDKLYEVKLLEEKQKKMRMRWNIYAKAKYAKYRRRAPKKPVQPKLKKQPNGSCSQLQ